MPAFFEGSSRERTAKVLAIFMVFGAIFWPGSGTELPNGTYEATYINSSPGTSTQAAQANLDVGGETVFVTADDLTGSADANSTAFFGGRKGETIRITVKNGLITQWIPA